MASKRHRKVPRTADRPQKDRAVTARKVEMERLEVKEAEMEAKVLGAPHTVVVVCPTCKQRSEFEVRNGVPVAPCPVCGTRLSLRQPGVPQVVNR